MSARKHFTCTVPGCQNPHWAKGLCGTHYARSRRPKGVEPNRAINDISGSYNPHWKGGVHVRPDGRVMVRIKGHPTAHKSGYILRYRLHKEQSLGRLLRRDEVVHHENNNPADDLDSNTTVTNHSQHGRIHIARRRRDAQGHLL